MCQQEIHTFTHTPHPQALHRKAQIAYPPVTRLSYSSKAMLQTPGQARFKRYPRTASQINQPTNRVCLSLSLYSLQVMMMRRGRKGVVGRENEFRFECLL